MTPITKSTPSQRLFHAAHVERRKRFGFGQTVMAPPQKFDKPVAPTPAPKEPAKPEAVMPVVTPRLSVAGIQDAVARRFDIKRSDLTGPRRFAYVVRPRQIAIYLARVVLKKSTTEIGLRFGGRDHCTVFHAIRRIESLIQSDPLIRSDVEALRAELEGKA